MNQEPVAWIIQSKYGTPTIVWNGEPIKYTSNIVKQDDIPLYTTPPQINPHEWFDVVIEDEDSKQVIRFIECISRPNLYRTTKKEMLYTFKHFGWLPQYKELTDEEIKDEWFDINKNALSRIEVDMQLIFARAILKKASEK